jgi:hypothetical protein
MFDLLGCLYSRKKKSIVVSIEHLKVTPPMRKADSKEMLQLQLQMDMFRSLKMKKCVKISNAT